MEPPIINLPECLDSNRKCNDQIVVVNRSSCSLATAAASVDVSSDIPSEVGTIKNEFISLNNRVTIARPLQRQVLIKRISSKCTALVNTPSTGSPNNQYQQSGLVGSDKLPFPSPPPQLQHHDQHFKYPTINPPRKKNSRKSPVLDSLIRSVRFRSKSTSDGSPTNPDDYASPDQNTPSASKSSSKSSKNILKRVLLRRHKAKHEAIAALRNLSSVDDDRTIAPPPSISLLEGVLPPDAEYYVTVSGGDRSKLLTFHPKLSMDTFAAVDSAFDSPSWIQNVWSSNESNKPCGEDHSQPSVIDSSEVSNSIVLNTPEVFCAKIAANPISSVLATNSATPANIQLDAVSKSKYFVSALNFERDISNLSQLPPSGRSLPGITHFIYKSPPVGASVDIGVNQEILKLFDDQEIYSQFMKSHTCYQILPKSSTLIVFDSNLQVRKAFRALFENSIRAAIIWDGAIKDYVGMVTITDVIRRIRDSPDSEFIQFFDHETIWSLQNKGANGFGDFQSNIEPGERSAAFRLLSINSNESLYEATKRLSEYNVHRILVKDRLSGDALNIITHKRLLRFLYLYIHELTKPAYLSLSINELQIGTHQHIHTLLSADQVMTALKIFLDHDVSAVPVVEQDTGQLIDVYCKCDVIYLLGFESVKLSEINIEKALQLRQVYECYKTFRLNDSLLTVIDRLVSTGVHRLIGVDDKNRVVAIISLSDILCFLVLHAPRHDKDRKRQQLEDRGLCP